MTNFFRKNWDLVVIPFVTTVAFVVFGAMGLNTPIFEFLGIGLILMGLLFAKRESKLGPALMFMGNILLLFYFISINLFGQIIFTIFFLSINIATIYSWWQPNQKPKQKLRPSRINPVFWIPILTVIAVVVWWGTRGGITGGLDYLVMSAGIIGNTLLIKKKIEAWFLCLLCDMAGIILFILTGSWLLALKSIFSVYNEIDAIIKWRRGIKS